LSGRYVDSSVIISAFDFYTSMLVYVEVIRNLARLEQSMSGESVVAEFEDLFARMSIIEMDDWVWLKAAAVAMASGVKSLDALHLATASAPGISDIEFATFDKRLAVAARQLGMVVVP